jgi:hypothetical protein
MPVKANSVLRLIANTDVEEKIPDAEWVDPDDAPELDDEFFERADEYLGESLVRRGR